MYLLLNKNMSLKNNKKSKENDDKESKDKDSKMKDVQKEDGPAPISIPSRRYERITQTTQGGCFYTYDGRKERFYDLDGDEW